MDVPEIGAPRISLPPFTLLGHRADGRPIYNVAGGSDDEPDIEVDDGGDTADDTELDDEPDTGDDSDEATPKPAPPKTSKDPALERAEGELAKLRAALKKSNDDAKRHRLALKEREDRDRASEGDHERALREAREESENRWKPRIINQAARAALAEAGISGSPDRLLKLLDLDALSVDDDGDVIGLATEVDRLRADYPEFFAKPEATKPKARPTAAPKSPAPDKPKNSWDRHAARILQGG
ncbi:phage scaffolding protein [Kitasatospora camelliae]|uniref:Phage scaffolding protein n=1 Tax=Kitasatospora camelliae TaxID=3156397 RepID=A0AAU8K6N2_9ACTN